MTTVRREIVLPVERERAWELLTDPDWLADEVEFEAEEGAPLRFDDREGVVERVEPGELIEFSWKDSRVVWQLEDHDQGTRFVVTEERRDTVWGPKLAALASAAALCPA